MYGACVWKQYSYNDETTLIVTELSEDLLYIEKQSDYIEEEEMCEYSAFIIKIKYFIYLLVILYPTWESCWLVPLVTYFQNVTKPLLKII